MEAAEGIAIEDEHVFGLGLITGEFKTAAGTEGFGFNRVIDLERAVAVADGLDNHLGHVADGENYALEAFYFERIEKIGEQGATTNISQNFGAVGNDGTEPSASAAREDDDVCFGNQCHVL
jgi:hypothetical protein